MHIAVVSPSEQSVVGPLLPEVDPATLPGGYPGAPFIGTLVKGYLDRGCKVTALTTTPCMDGCYVTKRWRHGKFEWVVVPARPRAFAMNGWRPGRMIDFFRQEQAEIRNQLVAIGADVVHAHWSYEFAGAALKSRLPTLVTVHDDASRVFRHMPDTYRFARMVMSERYLRQVRWASTVSPYMERYVRARCQNVVVIPNPVEVGVGDLELRRRIEWRCGRLAALEIATIGNGWTSLKNGIASLRAFACVRQELPEARLHLFGAGTERGGKAEADAASLGLDPGGVVFHGAVSREVLHRELNECHLLVHPSREESFGMVLAEAMTLGVPAIGGLSSGAVPWVVQDRDLLCDFDKPQDVARLIMELVTNRDRYREKAVQCYQNVASRFDASVVVGTYLDHLSRIRRLAGKP